MRGSLGSTAFQLFDKVIVAILAILALFYGAKAFIEKPAQDDTAGTIKTLETRVLQQQEGFTHDRRELLKDYLTETVGGFRPDIVGVDLGGKHHLFGGPRKIWRTSVKLVKLLEAPAKPTDCVIPPECAAEGVKDQMAPGGVVTYQLDRAKRLVRLSPLREGGTVIQFLRDGKPVGRIDVTVSAEAEKERSISVPAEFAAVAGQGRAELSWGPAKAVEATVTQYRIYKAKDPNQLAEKELQPFLVVSVKGELKADQVLDTSRTDGDETPPAVFDGKRFRLADPDVEREVTHWYAVDAAGTAKDGKVALASAGKSRPVSVKIVEAFEDIEFQSWASDLALLVVYVQWEVGEDAKEGEPAQKKERVRLDYKFQVERGQPVGWPVPAVILRGKKPRRIPNVDFSTGYRLLDILDRQARVKKIERRGKVVQIQEENRPKVLLISERGRIKVFWRGRIKWEEKKKEERQPPVKEPVKEPGRGW